MKSHSIALFCLLLMVPGVGVFSQEAEAETAAPTYDDEIPLPEVVLVFGPRIGVSAIIMDPAKFNTELQVGFPRDVSYFPVFTEFGFTTKQLIAMGDSGRNLIIEETFLLGGLDQNLAIPALRLLLGLEGRVGSEIKVGPYLSFKDNEGKVGITASFIYLIGWTIRSRGMIVPIEISMVPQPSYWNPRITFTTGLSFRIPN